MSLYKSGSWLVCFFDGDQNSDYSLCWRVTSLLTSLPPLPKLFQRLNSMQKEGIKWSGWNAQGETPNLSHDSALAKLWDTTMKIKNTKNGYLLRKNIMCCQGEKIKMCSFLFSHWVEGNNEFLRVTFGVWFMERPLQAKPTKWPLSLLLQAALFQSHQERADPVLKASGSRPNSTVAYKTWVWVDYVTVNVT